MLRLALSASARTAQSRFTSLMKRTIAIYWFFDVVGLGLAFKQVRISWFDVFLLASLGR
jgi:hypothetical protein